MTAFAPRLVAAFALFWLSALAAVVAIGLLTRRISLRGLLGRKGDRVTGSACPERVQLLLVTLAIASTYAVRVAQAVDRSRLPDIDVPWLAGALGSHGVFLASKAVSVFRARRASQPPR